MKKARNKPLYAFIGLIIVILIGYLFIFIEERKFEAHYYKTELEKLQQQSGVTMLLQQAIEQAATGTALATLRQSHKIAVLSHPQISELVSELKRDASAGNRNTLATIYSLSQNEIAAITALLQTTTP